MARLLERVGVKVVEFNFPVAKHDRPGVMQVELEEFRKALSASRSNVESWFGRLQPVRTLLDKVDRLCWEEGRLPGAEARLLHLRSTDMDGDPVLFSRRLEKALSQFSSAARRHGPRIALFGVPSAITGLAEKIEAMAALLVLCETEHDFAMIPAAQTIEQQYLDYAYPYGIEARLDKFLRLAREREVEGVVVYSQSFCHHNLELTRVERVLRPLPTVVIESDVPASLSPRDLVRLEGFLSIVRGKSRRGDLASTRPSPPRPWGLAPPLGEHDGLGGLHQPSGGGIALGLDLGSRFAKILAVHSGEQRRLLVDTIEFYRTWAVRTPTGLRVDIASLVRSLGFLDADAPVNVVSTGYGRNLVSFENSTTVPEIQAHAAGAAGQVQHEEFLLIDFGGQDTKAAVVHKGAVVDFIMNDKCAAGSGRYVENMARLLGLPVEEVAARFEDPVELTNVCATFGESEVIGKIVEGVPHGRICAGIMLSVALRTVQLVQRLPRWQGAPVCLAGGLSESPALAIFLKQHLGASTVEALPEPRFNGALGALTLLHRASPVL